MSETKQIAERGGEELSTKVERLANLFKVGELVQKQVDKGNYFGLLLFADYALRDGPLRDALYQAVGYAFQGSNDEEKRAKFYEGLASYASSHLERSVSEAPALGNRDAVSAPRGYAPDVDLNEHRVPSYGPVKY